MFNAMIVKDWLRDNERSGLWLSRKTGLGIATVQRILSGNGQPSIESVAAIARATRLDVSDLISVEQPGSLPLHHTTGDILD